MAALSMSALFLVSSAVVMSAMTWFLLLSSVGGGVNAEVVQLATLQCASANSVVLSSKGDIVHAGCTGVGVISIVGTTVIPLISSTQCYFPAQLSLSPAEDILYVLCSNSPLLSYRSFPGSVDPGQVFAYTFANASLQSVIASPACNPVAFALSASSSSSGSMYDFRLYVGCSLLGDQSTSVLFGIHISNNSSSSPVSISWADEMDCIFESVVSGGNGHAYAQCAGSKYQTLQLSPNTVGYAVTVANPTPEIHQIIATNDSTNRIYTIFWNSVTGAYDLGNLASDLSLTTVYPNIACTSPVIAAASSSYVYVSCGDTGIYRFPIGGSSASSLSVLSHSDCPRLAWASVRTTALSGDILYAACADKGVVASFNDPVTLLPASQFPSRFISPGVLSLGNALGVLPLLDTMVLAGVVYDFVSSVYNVSLVSATHLSTFQYLLVCRSVYGLATSSSLNLAAVSCNDTQSVYLVSLPSGHTRLLSSIPGCPAPTHMLFSSQSSDVLYIACQSSNPCFGTNCISTSLSAIVTVNVSTTLSTSIFASITLPSVCSYFTDFAQDPLTGNLVAICASSLPVIITSTSVSFSILSSFPCGLSGYSSIAFASQSGTLYLGCNDGAIIAVSRRGTDFATFSTAVSSNSCSSSRYIVASPFSDVMFATCKSGALIAFSVGGTITTLIGSCPPFGLAANPSKNTIHAICSDQITGSWNLVTVDLNCASVPGLSVQFGHCLQCLPGSVRSFADTFSVPSCSVCAAGTFASSAGSPQCTSCSPGTYRSASDNPAACVACPTGTYQNFSEASLCPVCAEGFFAPSPGLQLCTPCPPGSYRSANTSAASCISCSQGTYQGNSGASRCEPCPPNTGQKNTGSTSCSVCFSPTTPTLYSFGGKCEYCGPLPLAVSDGRNCSVISCPAGQRFDVTQSICTLCPPGTFISAPGPNSECQVAPANTYAPFSGTINPISCENVNGITCSGGFALAQPGFYVYTIDNSTGRVEAVRCQPGLCVGQTSPNENQCASNRQDRLCGTCAEGHSEWNNACVPCETPDYSWIFFMVFMSFVWICFIHVSVQPDDRPHEQRSASFSIALYFIQIMSLMVGTYDSVVGWLNMFNFTITDAAAAGGGNVCVAPLGPYQKLTLNLLLPWLSFAQLFCIMVIHWLIDKVPCCCRRRSSIHDGTFVSSSSRSASELSHTLALPLTETSSSAAAAASPSSLSSSSLSALKDSPAALFAIRWGILYQGIVPRLALTLTPFILITRVFLSAIDSLLILYPSQRFAAFSLFHIVYLLFQFNAHPYSFRLNMSCLYSKHFAVDNQIATICYALIAIVGTLLAVYPPPYNMTLIPILVLLVTLPACILLVASIFLRLFKGYQRDHHTKRNGSQPEEPSQRSLSSSSRQTPLVSVAIGFVRHTLDSFAGFRTWRYFRTFVALILISYTGIATNAIRYYYCVYVDGVSVLYYSPAILCTDIRYKVGQALLAFQLLYICLVPISIWALLHFNRHFVLGSMASREKTNHNSNNNNKRTEETTGAAPAATSVLVPHPQPQRESDVELVRPQLSFGNDLDTSRPFALFDTQLRLQENVTNESELREAKDEQ